MQIKQKYQKYFVFTLRKETLTDFLTSVALIEVQDILLFFNIFRLGKSLLKTGWLLFFHKFPNRAQNEQKNGFII